MWIVIILFVLPFIAFIALAFFIISRVRKSVRAQAAGGAGAGKGKGFKDWDKMSRNMPTGEAMYAMMFPDLEPLFKPEGLLEWLTWYKQRRQSRQLIRDGRRWHGEVPGFPDAATMAVTAQGKEDNAPELMALQNAAGQTIVEVLIETKDDGRTLLTNNAGVFTLNPDDERKVRFKGNDERSFAWRGPGQWNLSGNQAMPAMQAQGSDLRLADSGTGLGTAAGVAGGVAAGVAVGMLADRVIRDREAARAQRQAQREAERKANAGGGSARERDNDSSSFSSLDTDY